MTRRNPSPLALLVAALALAASGCKARPVESEVATRRLAVLSTADEHSHQFAFAPELDDHPLPATAGSGALKAGAARRATLLAAERTAAAARGVDTITVSAGDFSQGTLAQVPFTITNPDLVMLARLHYDAVAIGAAAGRVTLPVLLLSNATFSGTAGDAPLAALFGERGSGKAIVRSAVLTPPSVIKVGLVSQLGPAAAFVAPLAAPIRFAGNSSYSDKAAAIAAVASQLQHEINSMRSSDKVDVVVLIGHGGVGATAGARGDDELLAAALSGVDLVVSGHTHLRPDAIRTVTDLEGHPVPVMQPAPFGIEVGRAELVIGSGRPTLDTDPAHTRFIPVDDAILPTTDAAVRSELDGIITALEERNPAAPGLPSFLEATLTVVLGGTPPTHVAPGDLYYKVLGQTAFDVPGVRHGGESNALNLDTDAMWAVANDFSPTATTTQIAVQARGPIRADLARGRNGFLSFADIYSVVPLGGDPVEGSPGYPLLRFYLKAVEVWGAFEYTLLFSQQDGDFYLSPAGIEILYDRTRTPFDPVSKSGGWITRMTLVDRAGARTDIFDVAAAPGSMGWLVDADGLISVVTPLYVAAFAQAAGISPRDAAGVPLASIYGAILVGGPPGQTFHWKDHQALAVYIAQACLANGGTLPPIYDEADPLGAVPRRVRCTGLACP